MPKWEYCVIERARLHDGKSWTLYMMTSKGYVQMRGSDSLAAVVALLGDEGWEMVGTGVVSVADHNIYFKRPKQ